MDRRKFLAFGAGVPVVGALILNKASVLDGELPAAPMAAPAPTPASVLYVPEKPTILTATEITRPVMELGMHVTDWSMDISPTRSRLWDRIDEPVYPIPPEIRVSIAGVVPNGDSIDYVSLLASGKRLRLYIVADNS